MICCIHSLCKPKGSRKADRCHIQTSFLHAPFGCFGTVSQPYVKNGSSFFVIVRDAEHASVTTVIANWIAYVLPKPVLATSYVLVLLVVGASLGWHLARQKSARITSELSERYAKAIDPHQGPWPP